MKESQVEFLKRLKISGGECRSSNCLDCIIREHFKDLDDCNIEECFSITCELLDEYNNECNLEGRYITIWED